MPQWYGQKHADPDRLGKVVYGLPELFREQIRQARLVANPGCYPTSAILPLAPLLKAGLIEPREIIVDSKSGVSGAGRTPKLTTHFPECNESISAYNVGRHRHTPEIEQMLSTASGQAVEVIFTPHLVPMDRGILVHDLLAAAGRSDRGEGACRRIREFYADEPFVRVVDHLPGTQGHARHEFLRHHGARGPRAGDHDQLPRQSDQGRLGRGGAEFQPDVRIRRNDGAVNRRMRRR